MFSQCSFKNATVPDLIDQIRQRIREYRANKSPDLLKEILACLEQARQILFKVLGKTNPNDWKRIREIDAKKKILDDLKKEIESL